MKYKIVCLVVLAVVAIVGFLTWLDAGCSLGGAITWSGKVCVENL